MNKQIVWVLFLVFGLTSVSFGMQPRPEPNFERLAAEISVTEDQMDEFIAIMENQHSLRKEIHEQEREVAKQKMDELRDGLLAKLEAILTEEQMALLKEKMEKRRKKKEEYRLLNAHRGACCHQ